MVMMMMRWESLALGGVDNSLLVGSFGRKSLKCAEGGVGESRGASKMLRASLSAAARLPSRWRTL